MFKVHADIGRCEGYANCVVAAPDVFALDEQSGTVEILVDQPPDSQRRAVEQAVRNCPVGALSIAED